MTINKDDVILFTKGRDDKPVAYEFENCGKVILRSHDIPLMDMQ